MVVGFACQWLSLLLRPDEVLSGIPDALVLEVAYNALGISFLPHHMRIFAQSNLACDAALFHGFCPGVIGRASGL